VHGRYAHAVGKSSSAVNRGLATTFVYGAHHRYEKHQMVGRLLRRKHVLNPAI